MKLAAIIAMLICGAQSSLAGKRISVAQLDEMLRLAQEGGKADAQIARSLAGVELTERITESVRTRLLSRLQGPRARDVLDILAEVSAFLDGPTELQAPGEQPSAAQQTRILVIAREYATRYVRTLPDFVCTRVTRRFDDYHDLARVRPEVWANLRLRSTLAGELSFSRGVESYKDQTASGNAAGGIQESELGLTSFGEFGSIMGALFIGDRAPEIAWGGWDILNGTRVAVFKYSVDAANSRYRVSYCCPAPRRQADRLEPVEVVSAYKGNVYIEPVSGATLRVTRQAVALPHDFPTHRADTVVDYGWVRIGVQSYLCPARSVILSDSTIRTGLGAPDLRYLNDIRFIRYHKFATTARLLGGDTADAGVAGPPENSVLDQPDPWLELDPSDELTQPLQEHSATGSRLQSAEPSLTIRTTTQLVEVPVIVRDRRGNPVSGLSKEDFQIYDNAKPQDVKFFGREAASSSCNETAAPPSPRRVFSTRREESIPTDLTVILIDSINTNWADSAYARLEAAKFLRRVPPGETVGIYTMGLGGFTKRADLELPLAGWLDRSDSKSRRIRVKGTGDNGGSSPGDSLAVLTSIAKHLGGMPGRKNLVWISAGFPQNSYDRLLQAAKIFNDANVAIYSVDAPGLQTAFPDATVSARTYDFEFAKSVSQTHTEPIHANQSTMLELSNRTGGRAFLNANDITGAIQAAFNDPACSYRLGFYPQALNPDGEYHEIVVRLAGHPDVRLRYRHGYFARRQAAR